MERTESNISTAFYTLHTVTYRDSIPGTEVRGGGISLIGDQYLLATGDGRMYVFQWQKGNDAFSIRQLPYKVPATFRNLRLTPTPKAMRANRTAAMPQTGCRGADLAIQSRRCSCSGARGQCSNLCVASLLEARRSVSWYVFPACLGPRAFLAAIPACTGIRLRGHALRSLRGETAFIRTSFRGMEVGGRLGFLGDQRLMLTLGDHDFTGIESKQMFSQDPQFLWKTILIHLDDGTSEMYSMGHRNPQGLYITRKAHLEHRARTAGRR